MSDYNSIEIKSCSSQKELENIVGENDVLNVFFSNNYLQFCNCKYLYLYSTDFVIPVLLNQNGPFRNAAFLSEPYRYGFKGEAEESFINSVVEYIRHNCNVHWIAETPAYALFSEAPENSLSIPFGSHIVDLSNDVDTLWSKVHSKHRNVIKKAEKEGVQIVKGNSEKILNDYHSIDIETWERSNVKASGVDHLKEMVTKLGDEVIFYLAYKDGVPQAGAIFYYNKAMCYYMHGASCNNSFTGSSNLLHWVAMQDMKMAGVKKYSYVGARIDEDPNSKFHGIQRFKERFGGELFVGERFKVIFSPIMYWLFKLLVSLKQSLHNRNWHWYKDSIDMELPKWKTKNR